MPKALMNLAISSSSGWLGWAPCSSDTSGVSSLGGINLGGDQFGGDQFGGDQFGGDQFGVMHGRPAVWRTRRVTHGQTTGVWQMGCAMARVCDFVCVSLFCALSKSSARPRSIIFASGLLMVTPLAPPLPIEVSLSSSTTCCHSSCVSLYIWRSRRCVGSGWG